MSWCIIQEAPDQKFQVKEFKLFADVTFSYNRVFIPASQIRHNSLYAS